MSRSRGNLALLRAEQTRSISAEDPDGAPGGGERLEGSEPGKRSRHKAGRAKPVTGVGRVGVILALAIGLGCPVGAQTGGLMDHLYSPDGMYMWDSWYLQEGPTTHLFHLQQRRPDSSRPEEDQSSIGHATSEDLLHWTEQPVVLRRGPAGALDDGALFTGYTVAQAGKQYLFYAGNHQEGPWNRQTLNLATSEDGGQTFTRYAGNPVIEPQAPYYYTWADLPLPFDYGAMQGTDCRDISIVRDPQGTGWLGYVVMRRKAETYYGTATIALCRSQDLIHWQVGPPCFTPKRYAWFEVPDVFELDGKWYLIALTGWNYGQRSRWSDPYLEQGTLVAQADRAEGPFHEVRDNLVLAGQGFQGFSARTVERNGERLMLYTRPEGAVLGRLSWPVKLVPRPGGGLLPTYWQGVDRAFGPAVTAPDQEMTVVEGWDRRSLESLPRGDTTFQLSATLNLGSARTAGLGFSCPGSGRHAGGMVALLDRANGEVALLNGFSNLQRRRWDVHSGESYRVRVVAVEGRLEMYVDDVLALQCFAPSPPGGVSLFVEEGQARFSGMEYRPGK